MLFQCQMLTLHHQQSSKALGKRFSQIQINEGTRRNAPVPSDTGINWYLPLVLLVLVLRPLGRLVLLAHLLVLTPPLELPQGPMLKQKL